MIQYNDDLKQEIRNANDIVDVVSQYVILKRSGKNFMGLCPFHKEKSPSFSVSPDRQYYHCFGCHKGGDVFNFIMEMERVYKTMRNAGGACIALGVVTMVVGVAVGVLTIIAGAKILKEKSGITF